MDQSIKLSTEENYIKLQTFYSCISTLQGVSIALRSVCAASHTFIDVSWLHYNGKQDCVKTEEGLLQLTLVASEVCHPPLLRLFSLSSPQHQPFLRTSIWSLVTPAEKMETCSEHIYQKTATVSTIATHFLALMYILTKYFTALKYSIVPVVYFFY